MQRSEAVQPPQTATWQRYSKLTKSWSALLDGCKLASKMQNMYRLCSGKQHFGSGAETVMELPTALLDRCKWVLKMGKNVYL